MKALTTLLAVGMLATTIAIADDSDDVKTAFLNLFTTLRAHDSQSMGQYYMPDYTDFGRGGGLLIRTALLHWLEQPHGLD